MIYLEISGNDGQTTLEAQERAVYVHIQRGNGALLRCVEPLGQGILSKDGSRVYQLPGKETLPQAAATAKRITEAEYHARTAQQA